MRVGFIGLGKLGAPVAEVLGQHHQVTGYDVEPRELIGVEIASDLAGAVAGQDLTFIAVPTPHHPEYAGERPTKDLPPRDFDYSTLESVVAATAGHRSPDHLVVVISTALPGTTRRLLAPLVAPQSLVYNPSFIAMGTVKADFTSPEFVTVGTHDGSRPELLMDCYAPIHAGIPAHFGTWEEIEAIKVFYNTFISFKLCFVNMIQDVAMRLGGMDVDVVTSALASATNRLISDKYLRAGMGDGGSCHPRDNIALRHLSQQLELPYDLFGAIVSARDGQAAMMASVLADEAERLGTERIVILGRSFKPEVEDPTGSPSVLVGSYLTDAGLCVTYDEQSNDQPAVYLIAHPDRYHGWPFADGSVVVDAYRSCPDIPGCTVIHYGNSRNLPSG